METRTTNTEENTRNAIIALADHAHELMQSTTDPTATRAHHRALALLAARAALAKADNDRARMYTRIARLHALLHRAVNELRDVDAPRARKAANEIWAEIGEPEKPFEKFHEELQP